MSRRICIALVCLALGWASNVNLAAAQSPGKPADKMVRVTYDVADLIVPIEDHTTFGERTPEKEGRGITKHTVALALVKRITDTVARETWESAGGKASIQYFPMSMAIVVNHREDVQKEIARLLTDLRRLGDVRVSMNVRLVGASPPMAKQLRAFMDAEGQPVRAWNIEKPAHVGRFVSVDDKQVLALLELAQNDRTAHIMQAPKLTIYNGQQAYINSRIASDGPGLRFDVWPTVAADRKSVRFCLHLELAQRGKKSLTTTEAIGAFAVPANRSLIWHIGDTLGQHLFIVATPRVIIVEEEENIFLGNIPPIPGCGNAEEQSVPEPKKPANQPNAKERAIQHRLSQPISLNFKDVPLREAIKEITIASGILVVPDLQSLKEAKVNLDYPVSGSVDNIAMKNALNILLKPMRLAWIIEDEVLKITTEDRGGRPIRKFYKVADLLDPLPTVEGDAPRKTDQVAEELKALIANTIAKNSWEDMGGTGILQYFPIAKTLVITQSQEVHEEIQLLLATMRKLQDVMVNVEVRSVHTAPGVWEAATNWNQALHGEENPPQFLIVDEKGMREFLEITKGQPETLAVPAPKLNVLNGQFLRLERLQKRSDTTEFSAGFGGQQKPSDRAATISKTERILSGWRYEMQPTVAPDRKSVRLNLVFEHFVPEGTIERSTKAAGTFTIEDQRTLVWHLGASADGQHLFTLVTPRVIVREPAQEEVSLQDLMPIPGR